MTPGNPTAQLSTPTIALAETLTLAPTSTFLPPTPSPSATSVPETAICSPLDGQTIASLSTPDLLKNPFEAPRAGYDDGHPGIDLAYWTRPDGLPMLGLPIHSVLSGRVAAVVFNRQPYGNMVIIETPLERLPAGWAAQVKLPTPQSHPQPSASLSCPILPDFTIGTKISLYLLYAHMQKPPLVRQGDAVSCAQPLGQVGTTGRSVNPHLHFEVRAGPANESFASIAHYDSSATPDEISAYCRWRISGEFPPIDPLDLFSLGGTVR